MVVKMRKWSPWPTMPARKFKVKVKLVKLEFELSNNGWNEGGGGDVEKKENVVAIKLKWKGEPKFGLVPFHRTSKRRTDFSTEKKVDKRGGVVLEWDDEFENVCSLSVVSSNDQTFGPWDISFSIIGEKMESKAKLGVIGRVTLNLAEMVSMMQPEVERKLPVNLNFGGVAIEANLLVLLNFVEIRDCSKDSEGTSENSIHSKRHTSEEGEAKLDNLGGPFTIDNENTTASETGLVNEMGMSTLSEKEIESVKKVGFFSWKRRRLRFSPTLLKGGEPLDKNTGSCIIGDDDDNNNNGTDIDLQSGSSSMVDSATTATGGGWESKEFISRDGETKVKTDVFFASFDQCSNKAAGEGACTALVAVIAHWLQLNPEAMPTRSEFDTLIVQGSQEWRKLCEIDAYMNNFPNKHFDLETVLGAGIRPISISHNDSFVGFFSPEKFESLKEAMSFDEIWDGINKINTGEHDNEQRIYIVSWNDHFFVLKVDADACYIIDTLGARLFEGCNQAYILRFDESSLMYGKKTLQEEEGEAKKTKQNEEDEQQMICRGKECCKEFMKRFLAAIPLQELEAEEKKGGPVSYYSLHHRLQIELNFSYLLSSSFLTSSPFSSSSSNCASSCATDEPCGI